MQTEFQVRKRIELIRQLQIAPLRKARLLLEIGRSLELQAKNVANSNDHLVKSQDPKASASLSRVSLQMKSLHDEVRDAAHEALTAPE